MTVTGLAETVTTIDVPLVATLIWSHTTNRIDVELGNDE